MHLRYPALYTDGLPGRRRNAADQAHDPQLVITDSARNPRQETGNPALCGVTSEVVRRAIELLPYVANEKPEKIEITSAEG